MLVSVRISEFQLLGMCEACAMDSPIGGGEIYSQHSIFGDDQLPFIWLMLYDTCLCGDGVVVSLFEI